MFATHGEEDEIYPLTIIEIAEAQKKDRNLKIYYKRNTKTPEKGMSFQLIEDTKYIKYGMLDNISLCGCPIPTPPVIAVVVALSVLHLIEGGRSGDIQQ